eukprot:COSAG04_NODE_16908_length_485_cov_1.183938_2_plen_32_part_01
MWVGDTDWDSHNWYLLRAIMIPKWLFLTAVFR